MPRTPVQPCRHCNNPPYGNGLCVRHYVVITHGWREPFSVKQQHDVDSINTRLLSKYEVQPRTPENPLTRAPGEPQTINHYQWQVCALNRYGDQLGSLLTDADETGLREIMTYIPPYTPVHSWQRQLLKMVYTKKDGKISPAQYKYTAKLDNGVLEPTFNDGMPIPRFIRRMVADAAASGLLSAKIKKIPRKRKPVAKKPVTRTARART